MRARISFFSSKPALRALSGLGVAAFVLASSPSALAENVKPAPANPAPAAPAAPAPSPAKPAPAKPAEPAAGPVLTGFWTAYNDDGKPGGIFYFYEKDGLYEGRLVKEITYPEDPPENPLCTHCPGEKKDKPMLGLVIVWGMKKHGVAKYEDGKILDPRNGSVWSAELDVTPDNQKLNLRGYVATPLFGQTRVWTRLPDDTMALADIPGDPLVEVAPATQGKKPAGHVAPTSAAPAHAAAPAHPAAAPHPVAPSQ